MAEKRLGVVVGRFQTPRLHSGHFELLNRASRDNDTLVICVGLKKRIIATTDPLDFPTRSLMLYRAFPRATILPLYDIPGDDKAWVEQLNRLVGTYKTEVSTLYGGRDSFLEIYAAHSTRYATVMVNPMPEFSGTNLRARAAAEVRDTEDFRQGVIYGLWAYSLQQEPDKKPE